VQALCVDVLELRRPEIELPLVCHHNRDLAIADHPGVFPPLRIRANLVADRFIVTVNLSAIIRAPDSTERGEGCAIMRY
jgi:hypothetical protein